MTTYSIYTHNNGQDGGSPIATVVLNDDDSEVVSITSDDPSVKSEAESVISDYMASRDGERGMSAVNAVLRYGGSYGEVKVTSGEKQ